MNLKIIRHNTVAVAMYNNLLFLSQSKFPIKQITLYIQILTILLIIYRKQKPFYAWKIRLV